MDIPLLFVYNDHKDESYHEVTISVFKFMTLLTMHIYPKISKLFGHMVFTIKNTKLHLKLII